MMDEDLSKYMRRLGHLPLCKVKFIMSQVLAGVAHCHRTGVLHLDLKPENVLLKNRGGLLDVKLADFGAAWGYRSGETGPTWDVTTYWYRAPERFLGVRENTPASDMWSVGCILAELLSHEPLFPARSEEMQLRLIVHLMGTPTEDNCPGCSQLPLYQEQVNRVGIRPEIDLWNNSRLPHEANDLLRKLVCLDPCKRISAEAALQHPFFAGVEQPPPPFALNTPIKVEAARQQGAKQKRSIDGCEADQCSPSLQRDFVQAKRARPGQNGQEGSVVVLPRSTQGSLEQREYMVDLTDSPAPAQLLAQTEDPQPPLPSEVWPPLPSGLPPASPAVTQPLSPAGRPAVPPYQAPPGLPAVLPPGLPTVQLPNGPAPPAVLPPRPPAQPPAGHTAVPPPRPPPGSPPKGAAAAAPAQAPAHLGRIATRSVAGATRPVMVWHHPGHTVAGQQLHYGSAWDPHYGTAAQLAYPYSAMYGQPVYAFPPVAPFNGSQAAGWAYTQPL
ncbi:probable negative regulator of the PHO system at N-terminal half [Coccomyxa sp. Obi]|nr:probable negative regulator of the PHO system at N-terminal half [Coccomyxa sp. Obi]